MQRYYSVSVSFFLWQNCLNTIIVFLIHLIKPSDDYFYSGKQPALGRFLLPVAECTFALEQVLEDLQKDPWTCQPDERVKRCTGTALTVALVSECLNYLLFFACFSSSSFTLTVAFSSILKVSIKCYV